MTDLYLTVFESACEEDAEIKSHQKRLDVLNGLEGFNAIPSEEWLRRKLQTEQAILSRRIELSKIITPDNLKEHLLLLIGSLREKAISCRC